MKHYFIIIAAIVGMGMSLCACSDSDDNDNNGNGNWQVRNEAFFQDIRKQALTDIANVKQLYGNEWQEHSNWRAFLSYSLSETAQSNTSTDSIFVKIIKRGEGSGCPIGSDSVRIFYAGRLIPTAETPAGFMFDHSGQSSIEEKIFDRTTNIPSTFKVTDCVKGFATALQQMHIGDRWRIYVPQQLGYKQAQTQKVPPFSTLVFEVELVQYAHAGSMLPPWN